MARTISRPMPLVREVKKKFKLILSADWHLRDDIPQCRERDEYLAAQERKLKFIHDLVIDNDATLLVAGDLWDNWKPSPWLISLALRHLPSSTIVAPGQHDMVSHNLSEMGKTGLQTLAEAGAIVILSGGLQRIVDDSMRCFGYAYGESISTGRTEDAGMRVLLWHHLTCKGKQPWPEAGATTTDSMIKALGQSYQLIVTGDNHQQFWGPGYVNPGSLMRMSSDQAEFEPAVFGWSEDGTVTRIPLPIEKGVVKATKSNAKAKESRDARMSAYIERAGRQYETSLSFTKNLEQHFRTNKETKGVETITWRAVETK